MESEMHLDKINVQSLLVKTKQGRVKVVLEIQIYK